MYPKTQADELSCRAAQFFPHPSDRIPITFHSYALFCSPPFICYFATAFLSLLPDTFPIRLSLLPITLGAAFRAATSVDASGGLHEFRYVNMLLCVSGFFVGILHRYTCVPQMVMTMLSMRSIDLTFRRQPLKRDVSGWAERGPSHSSVKILLYDTIDLTMNMRGLGWSFSDHIHIPQETRPTSSTSAFVLATAVSAVRNFLWFDAFIFGCQSLVQGRQTLFNPLLPPVQRHAQAFFTSWLAGMSICMGVDFIYDIATIVSILAFGQHPLQWPPIFDRPWKATSLSVLWSKHWHQFLRVRIVSSWRRRCC